MKHTPSKIKVFQTDDYKRFQSIDGNRSLNEKKIKSIISEIESGNDILDEVPVLVRETSTKLEVLDGQHRLEVAKRLKRPVFYIIHGRQMSLYQVARVNTNVEKWKDQDFINCYVKAGNDNYSKIQAFKKKYGIPTTVALMMLHGGMEITFSDERLRKDFQQGSFQVLKYKEACQLAEICKRFEAFPSWNSRSFIFAIIRIVKAEKADMAILVKKFSEYPDRLRTRNSWKAYLTNLEEIYNINNSKRRVIF